jgi:hypothetical protein
MKREIISGLILIVFLGSCNLFKKGTARTDAYASYREDLSSAPRVTFEDIEDQMETEDYDFESGELAVDEGLSNALRYLENNNKQERYYSGYTVLVYSGVDRDEAFQARNNLYSQFPDIELDLQYQQPRYLVKIGKYINRIEAQEYFHKVKDLFPSARIIQDRFQRNGEEGLDVTQNGERQN